MAYVAVSGGGEALDRAASLVERSRLKGPASVELQALENRLSLLIDRIMGEAGFYAPHYAALALKQSEGAPEEAVFLLRAYRSTLTRAYCSLPLDGADMNLQRRISAAFKDITGGQFLGATYDYTHRLLDFELASDNPHTEVQGHGKEKAEIKEEIKEDEEKLEVLIKAPRVSGCSKCLELSKTGSHMEHNRCKCCATVWAARDISIQLREGEILGVVGESGSGKTTLMKALYLDTSPTSGTYYLGCYENGERNIFSVSLQQRKHIRNRFLGMVYQNPYLGLRMHFSAGANVAEKLIAAGSRNVTAMMGRTANLLEHIEVPVSRIKEPPRNFSGGMQQRIQIAKAVANNPPILLLDEVTTGLDLSVQARVLDLVKKIQREFDATMIVVSHDLAVVRMLADRTVVMLDGCIVEEGITDQIMEDPQHYYTQELVSSLL